MKLLGLLLIAAALISANAAQPVSSPRLIYATYFGTGPNSIFYSLAVDSAGYAYVAGSGPGAGNLDCGFLTKLNQTGTTAVWSICLPVTQIDGVAVDAAGYIYAVGSNPPVNFVHTTAVMKLSPDDRRILYAAQIGGAYAG